MQWNAVKTTMLEYPHAQAIGNDEVRIAFVHLDTGVGLRVLHRPPVVVLIAELGTLGELDPIQALRFNTLATQRIGIVDDRYILRAELAATDLARQVTAFVHTAAALRRRRRRSEHAVFAFAV